ncbi:DNA polymerase IV [Furfurilactobacillus siliginis]|uniref:DNA polymerase IV n=1 Tax=Furfurilactobacillus siliginis TaxID=348151 RepID=A0A0R2L8K7_9LACO|nr:DNA polymerase IV [Furfurilactobacillus siliginis]KRN95450.1 DNA-directed DNA polymerase IV [Furfurilactobacillus siliginis]GEK28223.1 DNA polymerase IV [Furfurilactobacillus siliginis]
MGESLLQVPLTIDTSRKIIHVDMDAFYASIEERDHPEFRTHPLIIAKDPRTTGGHGVVTTANYAARKLGVHSAMSAAEAQKLAPKATFKTPDFTTYRAVSAQIHKIFHEYTDHIEPIAFDEAYLDVTNNKQHIDSAVALAHKLQAEIWETVHLTCSTGISYNKFLAKLASDYAKPVGVTVILPGDAERFLAPLSIEKFRGVGKKTVPKMQALGITDGAALLKHSEADLMQHFGKLGYGLYRHVRGSDDRPVEWQRERKSIGREETYDTPLTSEADAETQLQLLATELVDHLMKQQRHGQTIVLKVRDAEFNTLTKRVTQTEYYENDAAILYEAAKDIFDETADLNAGIRLLGITMTNLAPLGFENLSLPLWTPVSDRAF